MLTETIASAILTASITGAGLIIAIYALMTPISSKLFQNRVELLRKRKKQFDNMKEKIDSESSLEDIKQLKTLAAEMQGIRTFPKYLGFGVMVVFVFYLVTAMLTLMWMGFDLYRTLSFEMYVISTFAVSIFSFCLVGSYAIVDVYLTMKREFEELKKQIEEAEKISKELEQSKKELKPKYTKSQ